MSPSLSAVPIVLGLMLPGLLLGQTASASVEPVAKTTGAALEGPVRGAILDVRGRTLVSDATCWDVLVRHEVLAAHVDEEADARFETYLRRLVMSRVGREHPPDVDEMAGQVAELRDQVKTMWTRLPVLAGVPVERVEKAAREAVTAVQLRKDALSQERGREVSVAQERTFRPLLKVESAERGLEIQEELGALPWIRLTRSRQRVCKASDAMVSVLGKVGSADARRIAADPLRADPLHALRPGDRCGVSGVERLADTYLRPARGAAAATPASTGISLTIDSTLQADVYKILKQGVDRSPHPSGGAAVVLDVDTAEVRALVSYPSPAYRLGQAERSKLSRDNRWQPLRFRAVSSVLPPGSTIKPVTLYASLAEGVVTTATTVNCKGVFRAGMPDAFRCWVYTRNQSSHGVQDAEAAIMHSCNIFFFTAGDKLGAQKLVEYFGTVGLGQTQGTALSEESPGFIPTPVWLVKHRPKNPRYEAQDAWYYAFGQGELGVTPLQQANLAATIARGRFLPVTLARDAAGRRIGPEKPPGPVLDDRFLSVPRRGMWRVVNEKGGTADRAKLSVKGYALCGKTGSAQDSPRVIGRRFTFRQEDGEECTVDAASLEEARDQLEEHDAPLVSRPVAATWPPRDEDKPLPAHAWFLGYTQLSSTPRGSRPGPGSQAIAVLVEYGGAGGEVAAPIARRIAEHILKPLPQPKKVAAKGTAKPGKKPAAKPKLTLKSGSKRKPIAKRSPTAEPPGDEPPVARSPVPAPSGTEPPPIAEPAVEDPTGEEEPAGEEPQVRPDRR